MRAAETDNLLLHMRPTLTDSKIKIRFL